MPIYEYRCHGCGRDLELMQNISDKPLRKCPECGALKLQKLISAPRFKLTGSGWYETDYKDKPKDKTEDKNEKSSESEAQPKAGTTGDNSTNAATGSETKSESKARKDNQNTSKAETS